MTSDIDWAKDVLKDKSASVETIVETPYSTVHKLTSDGQEYYLKKVPEAYFIEADILERLGQSSAKSHVPHLVGSDETLSAFIVKADGQQTVRQYLQSNDMDIDLVQQGLMIYQAVQAATAEDTDFYLQRGSADWRLNKIPALYDALVQNDDLMTLWKMDDKKRKILSDQMQNVKDISASLGSYGLPETLNHCDLHNNNIVTDSDTKKLTVIDWAETSVGHPVLSVEPFFRSLRKHHGMTRETPDYIKLQDAYLKQWGLPKDEVRPMLNTMGNIYYVLCMQNVINLTGNRFEKWAGDVTGALDDFIDMSKHHPEKQREIKFHV